VKNKILYFVLISAIGLAGCVDIESQTPEIILPEFVTATLPATPIPKPTITPLPPTSAPTIVPIDGTTTTKINVRAETSSASNNLGTVDQYSTVQVIGKDTTGNWYQIIFIGSPKGVGWVHAEYVQFNTVNEIPIIESSVIGNAGPSGLVTQGINVRSGPGTDYISLGILNQKDIVTMTGRTPDASWIQIVFEQGEGWLSAQYLESSDIESLPVIDSVNNEVPVETSETPPTNHASTNPNDGDTKETPLADIAFGNANLRSFRIDGYLSNSTGDTEDWIKFVTSNGSLSIHLKCSVEKLQIELWKFDGVIEIFYLGCGESHAIRVETNVSHWLRVMNQAQNIISTTYNLGISVDN